MDIQITCGACGHAADFDDFCTTPVGGDLPAGQYQCPACLRAFRRKSGPGTHYPSGLYVPGEAKIVTVETRL